MKDTIFTISETDLASRYSAARLRARVEDALAQTDAVIIDLKAVLSISESYADELFGVFAARHGLEELVRRIHIRNASESALVSIASAVKQRLNENAGGPDIALLAARKALELRRQSAR